MSEWVYNYSNELYHYGTLGQKWGIRKYQYGDGSLTPAGKIRYGVGRTDSSGNYKEIASITRNKSTKEMSTKEITAAAKRKQALEDYKYAKKYAKKNAKDKAKASIEEEKANAEKDLEAIKTETEKIKNTAKAEQNRNKVVNKDLITRALQNVVSNTIQYAGNAAGQYMVLKLVEGLEGRDVAKVMFNKNTPEKGNGKTLGDAVKEALSDSTQNNNQQQNDNQKKKSK